MPGTYIKPKAYNRRFFIDIGTSETPKWVELARGIASRSNSFTEETENYYYMDGRGTAETDATTQTVTRTFSGNRVIGDEAQDYLFFDNVYNLDGRVVPFMEFYDNMETGKENGWKGTYTLSISDDGSGDATARETVGINASINGIPERGTVTLSDGVPTFSPASTLSV